MALIEVNHLSKQFQVHHLEKRIEVLDDVSFKVENNEFLGILGRSGSGKSTIIKCIYRTYLASSGSILYRSQNLGEVDLVSLSEREVIALRQQELGYVSQFLSVMPRTSAFDLVSKSLMECGVSRDQADEETAKVLTTFRLPSNLWNSYPHSFSGGEKLRLNIAKAIVKRPRLLLLDEPTASLDDDSKQIVREVIETLKTQGTTMIGIFHDLKFIEGLCEQVYRMEEKRVEPWYAH